MEYADFEKLAKKLAKMLKDIPKEWDGKEAILEMKEGGSRQWRQMEWIGFYFEFLCGKFLSVNEGGNMLAREGDVAYGSVRFDGFQKIPWDYKAHATNTSSHKVVINDREAIEKSIRDYGAVGVIMAIGDVEYNDKKRTFQKWHSDLKGGKSNYEKERIKRGAWSRFRKTKFSMKHMWFIKIDKKVLENAGSFQTGFRNSDGSPRREKVLLDLEQLTNIDYYTVDF